MDSMDNRELTPSRGWTDFTPMETIIKYPVQFEVRSLPRANTERKRSGSRRALSIELRVRGGEYYTAEDLLVNFRHKTHIFFEHLSISREHLTLNRTILRNLCEATCNKLIYHLLHLIYYDTLTVSNNFTGRLAFICGPTRKLSSCPVRNQMVPQRV